MASASRLLPPVPPQAAQLRGPRDRLAVPRLRCRAAAAATDGAVLLERGGLAAVAVREFVTLDELRAAVRLRVRTFYEYAVDSVGTEVNEDIQTRAYLSNVCVAKELQKKGLGYTLVDKSKKLAREWGITDLYVHVAIDNIAGQKLYEKSGFVYEGEEPAWKARYLGRPRRLLLWLDMSEVPL